SLGDVNGDGLSDLLLGDASAPSVGKAAFVIYGNATGTGLDFNSGILAASQGFKITDDGLGYTFGATASGAGDFNGDGLSDLIVGDYSRDSSKGAYYLVMSSPQTLSNAVSLTGTSAGETVLGTINADTLIGNGGVDRFYAGRGNDTMVLQASDASNLSTNTGATRTLVDGGEGFDTIRLSAGMTLDLTAVTNAGAMGLEENSRIESIERIDMATDISANTLTLSAKDVNDMAGFNAIRTSTTSDDGKTWTNVTGTALSATTKFHQVVVDGTSADKLTLEVGNGYWANVGEVSNGTTNYFVFQNTDTNSQVIVDKSVVVDNKDSSPAGSSVIDLGASGKLIKPVQVEGKWYYYWDRSGDGTSADVGSLNGGADSATHDSLDAIFNQDINGVVNPNAGTGTNDVYRYATINGVQVSVPTINGNITSYATGGLQNGQTAATGGGATNNSVYDELLAVWDNAPINSGNNAVPAGWRGGLYMAATSTSATTHVGMGTDGSTSSLVDTNPWLTALQVVGSNAAPVLDAAQSPTLTSVSAAAAAPVNGNTTAGDLVSSLVGGITDADGAGVAKGIAITGVRAGATLYYTVDGGTTWLTATGVSETNALLLAADSNTRVFYKTTTAGTVTDAFTFRAWDVTANITEGVYTDTTPRGGKAQFSLTSDTVGVAVTAPVVLDLNRDGMLSYGQVTMDVNGDGLMDLTRWAGAQDGVLVWDKFADGLVYNNSQYAFGQYATTYRMDALGFARTATDLEGLADAFDTNQDGKFNAADAKFAQFSVWQDANQDGISGVGEVRSLADLGVTEINLVSDGVVRTPEDGVFEAGQSTATLADGTSMLIADVAFAYATASSLSSAKLAADTSVAGDATSAESTTAELLPADIVTEFNNKPYMLSDEELAALNPLGQTAQAEDANVIEVTLNEAQLIDEAFFVGARPLVEPALVEATNVDITPEDVAAAIAVCTGAAESSTYSLSFGQSLDLTTVLKDMSFNGIVKGLEQVDMATDTSANKVSLTLADVLSLPPTNGVYQLVLSGAANDKVMLTEGEWTDTGTVVNQNGQNYAVYSGTTDPSAQLLIDQHMLQSHQTS
ncbi:VCBS repeat-containing protein, partial [Limnohabitans sp. 2KL-3]|uniref:FG-GAP repeat domain-containing protein n=1 Tax=Limnohabitans sp. 2KL-3 TaxID=1100700 RepID=UPI000A9E8959